MLKYARKKGSSKSKKKGQKNTGHPIQLWRYANPANLAAHQLRGEYESADRAYANGSRQHRGHVHLAQCDCQKALGPRPKTEAEMLRAAESKRVAKALDRQISAGRNCPACFLMLPITGQCDNCR